MQHDNNDGNANSMNPEFLQHNQGHQPTSPIDQLVQALSNIILQVNHTNQAMLSFLSARSEPQQNLPDSRVRPKPFSGLPSEDVLSWLDHFEMVASYHQWPHPRKAMEMKTLLENIAATWLVQQPEETRNDWDLLRAAMIRNFAHQDSRQTALQQLESITQQPREPITQFAVRFVQILRRADANMSEDMKLFFFWPRIRHDLRRRVRDQGPTTLHEAILTAQRIEAADAHDMHTPGNLSHDHTNTMPAATPMDIDIQNAQLRAKRALPERDSQGRPKCFYCNNYGHIRRHCRKWQNHQQKQNVQLADAASLSELPEN